MIRRWAGCEDPRQPRKTITRTKTSSMSPSTSTSTTRTRTKMIWKPFRCQATSLSPSSALWRLRLPKRPDCHYETDKIYLKFGVQKKLSSKLRHMKIIPQIRKQKKRGGTRAYIDINFENTNPELIDWFSNSINQFLILNYRSCAVTYKPPPTACRHIKTFNKFEFLITLSEVWDSHLEEAQTSLQNLRQQSWADPNWLKYVPHSCSRPGGWWLVKLSESILRSEFLRRGNYWWYLACPSCTRSIMIKIYENIYPSMFPSYPHTS